MNCKGLSLAGVVFLLIFASVTAAHAINPIYSAHFSEPNFTETGWVQFPTGDPGEYELAEVSTGLISQVEGYSDSQGIRIQAATGQGGTIFGPVVQTGDVPVLVRVSVHTLSAGGTIAVGALDADASGSLETMDGSICFALEMKSETYADTFHQVSVLYKPKRDAIVPVLQLVGPSGGDSSSVTAMFDNVEVYPLTQETVPDAEWQTLLGITDPGAAIPTPTPTLTPTPTPGESDFPVRVDANYYLPLGEEEKALHDPALAFDRDDEYTTAMNVISPAGFQDVAIRDIDTEAKEVSPSIIVNELFENTKTKQPDISIDFSGVRHVAWTDNRDIEKTYSVYVSPMDGFGNRLLENDILVNDLFENTNTQHPAIAGQGNGTITVSWIDDRHFAEDLYIRRLLWNGTQMQWIDEADIALNSPFENTDLGEPDIAMDEDGHIAVVWPDNRLIQNDRQRWDIYGRFFPVDAEPTDDDKLPDDHVELQISIYDSDFDHARLPRVAISNGNCLIAWVNENPSTGDRAIHGAVADTNGKLVHSEFLVDGGEGINNTLVDVKAIEENRFLILWQDEAIKEIFVTVYDAAEHSFLTDGIGIIELQDAAGNIALAVDNEMRFLSLWDYAGLGDQTVVDGLSGLVDLSHLNAKIIPQTIGGGVLKPMNVSPLSKSNIRLKHTKEKKENVETSTQR
ncbi:hypothetical protein GF373_07195 [bacterium]|nr:hypothetical protein [bacterium]